jgi:hypothetical protein
MLDNKGRITAKYFSMSLTFVRDVKELLARPLTVFSTLSNHYINKQQAV